MTPSSYFLVMISPKSLCPSKWPCYCPCKNKHWWNVRRETILHVGQTASWAGLGQWTCQSIPDLQLSVRSWRPLFQIASSRFGSLSVCCHTDTRYANAPHLIAIQWQGCTFWKDKTVNLAYSLQMIILGLLNIRFLPAPPPRLLL